MKKLIFVFLFLLSATSAYSQKEKGYEFSFETGYEIGVGETSTGSFQIISMINGYRINPDIFMGLGLSINAHEEGTLIPIYGQLKYNLNKKNTSPFALLKVGYSLKSSSDKIRGFGFTISPNIGFDFRKKHKTSFYIMTGMNFQWGFYHKHFNDFGQHDPRQINKLYLYIPIKIGATF